MTVYTILAPGLEETEAIAVIDVLRRAGINVKTLGIGTREIIGSHAITIIADGLLKNLKLEKDDVLFLPGGMPGTIRLRENKIVRDLLVQAEKNNILIAAICAAPTALAAASVGIGKKITSHPSVRDQLIDYDYSEERVVDSGTIVTSRGMGTAIELGIALVAKLVSREKALEIKTAILAR